MACGRKFTRPSSPCQLRSNVAQPPRGHQKCAGASLIKPWAPHRTSRTRPEKGQLRNRSQMCPCARVPRAPPPVAAVDPRTSKQ
eukprot:9471009-Pyramimonas_sp.AAC.2